VGLDAPRADLYRQAIAFAPHQAKAAPTQRPAAPERNWISRHKVLTGVLAGAVGFFAWWYAECVSSGESCAP
jgi:hypothetical protein